MAIYDWVVANWAAIASTVAAVLLLADKIVALTPSKADDEVVAKIEAIVNSIIAAKK